MRFGAVVFIFVNSLMPQLTALQIHRGDGAADSATETAPGEYALWAGLFTISLVRRRGSHSALACLTQRTSSRLHSVDPLSLRLPLPYTRYDARTMMHDREALCVACSP